MFLKGVRPPFRQLIAPRTKQNRTQASPLHWGSHCNSRRWMSQYICTLGSLPAVNASSHPTRHKATIAWLDLHRNPKPCSPSLNPQTETGPSHRSFGGLGALPGVRRTDETSPHSRLPGLGFRDWLRGFGSWGIVNATGQEESLSMLGISKKPMQVVGNMCCVPWPCGIRTCKFSSLNLMHLQSPAMRHAIDDGRQTTDG